MLNLDLICCYPFRFKVFNAYWIGTFRLNAHNVKCMMCTAHLANVYYGYHGYMEKQATPKVGLWFFFSHCIQILPFEIFIAIWTYWRWKILLNKFAHFRSNECSCKWCQMAQIQAQAIGFHFGNEIIACKRKHKQNVAHTSTPGLTAAAAWLLREMYVCVFCVNTGKSLGQW